MPLLLCFLIAYAVERAGRNALGTVGQAAGAARQRLAAATAAGNQSTTAGRRAATAYRATGGLLGWLGRVGRTVGRFGAEVGRASAVGWSDGWERGRREYVRRQTAAGRTVHPRALAVGTDVRVCPECGEALQENGAGGWRHAVGSTCPTLRPTPDVVPSDGTTPAPTPDASVPAKTVTVPVQAGPTTGGSTMAEITHEMLVATVEQCQADAQTLAGRLEVLEAQAVSVGHASAVRVALAKAFEAIANAEVAVTSIRQELTDGGHDDIAAQLAGREVAETEYYGGVRAA